MSKADISHYKHIRGASLGERAAWVELARGVTQDAHMLTVNSLHIHQPYSYMGAVGHRTGFVLENRLKIV